MGGNFSLVANKDDISEGGIIMLRSYLLNISIPSCYWILNLQQQSDGLSDCFCGIWGATIGATRV